MNKMGLFFIKAVATLIEKTTLQAKGFDDDILEGVQRVLPYGFSHKPFTGSQPCVVFPSGDRAAGVAIIVADKRYLFEVIEGEVALHDHQGQHVHIKADGVIEVKANTKVIADCPMFEATQNATIGGILTVKGMANFAAGADVKGAFKVNDKNIGESHTHNISGSQTLGVN